MRVEIEVGPEEWPRIVLNRIRPERNERQFYALGITCDLFGQIQLLRNWGRIGTSGRLRHDGCASAGQALAALHRLARAKRQRGYVEVCGPARRAVLLLERKSLNARKIRNSLRVRKLAGTRTKKSINMENRQRKPEDAA